MLFLNLPVTFYATSRTPPHTTLNGITLMNFQFNANFPVTMVTTCLFYNISFFLLHIIEIFETTSTPSTGLMRYYLYIHTSNSMLFLMRTGVSLLGASYTVFYITHINKIYYIYISNTCDSLIHFHILLKSVPNKLKW